MVVVSFVRAAKVVEVGTVDPCSVVAFRIDDGVLELFIVVDALGVEVANVVEPSFTEA